MKNNQLPNGLKEPAGWGGNVYYVQGKGYATVLKPGKEYLFDVIYPVVDEGSGIREEQGTLLPVE